MPIQPSTCRMRSGVAMITAMNSAQIARNAVPAVEIIARDTSARLPPSAPPGPMPAMR
jgi:hypothetical protein